MNFNAHLKQLKDKRTALSGLLIDGQLIDKGDDHVVLAWDAVDRAVQHMEKFNAKQRAAFEKELAQ